MFFGAYDSKHLNNDYNNFVCTSPDLAYVQFCFVKQRSPPFFVSALPPSLHNNNNYRFI